MNNKSKKDFNYIDTKEQMKAVEDAATLCAMELGGGLIELEFLSEIIESLGYKNVNKSIIVSILDIMAKSGELTKRGYYTWTIDELSEEPKEDGFLSKIGDNIKDAVERLKNPEKLLESIFGDDPVVKEEINNFVEKFGLSGTFGIKSENKDDALKPDAKTVNKDGNKKARKAKETQEESFVGELKQNDNSQWLVLKADGVLCTWADKKTAVIVEVCDEGWRLRLPENGEEIYAKKVFFSNQGKKTVKIILHNEERLEPVVFEKMDLLDDSVHLFKKQTK